MLSRSDRFAALVAALLVAACSTTPVGPQNSGIAAPSTWNALQISPVVAETEEVDQLWWKQFRDPVLAQLIAEALANNRTLAVAKARVEEARANRGVARAALFPDI